MKNMPWYTSVIVAVVIFALAHFFYFAPQNTKLQALRADRVKIEGEVKDLKQKKKELDKIEQELVLAVEGPPLDVEVRTEGDDEEEEDQAAQVARLLDLGLRDARRGGRFL
ncbi:MAG TPA: hypothetical protein VEG35_03330, partial [Burkholderiales bacterium]|nr:hypothetical protein [Burkholderiales bacterium]